MPPSAKPVVTEPPEPPAPSPAVQTWPVNVTTHVVARGESLSVIANKYGLSVKELAAINGIQDPNKIYIGQKLTLPAGVESGSPPAPSPAPAPSAASAPSAAPVAGVSGDVYVVQRGDCLSVIASRLGVKTADLKKANSLTDDKILVGQKLQVPRGGRVPAAVPVAAAPAPAPVSPRPRRRPGAPAAVEPAPAPAPAPAPDPVAIVTPEPEPEPEPEPAPAPRTFAYRTHVVEEGEDLFSVAMMWGVSVEQLRELNELPEDAKLATNQRLKIPITE
jgi:LysM repeat protein